MHEQDQKAPNAGAGGREPVFLLPAVITALIGIMVAIHAASTLVLNQEGYGQVIRWFAFLPLRILAAGQDPALALPLVWTPFTHALLHGGWDHLLINMAWLAIFGTPVARRYGPWAMLALFFVASAAGAALFAATTLQSGAYLVGASGGIAGLTGAAVRFIFQPVLVSQHPETGERIVLGRRLASFADLAGDTRARMFILVWVVLNAAVPLLPMLTGTNVQVAWQAHLGGFFAGLLLVGLFERRQ
ncbi:rhomboid family intramembrane serine protease [uncultured Devosia sp.]|uniref:rhomboid family intramembrane serine protease n=1 Tax=uncultured Devosia sp. TaxID=211434 RepID=UPI0035CA1381